MKNIGIYALWNEKSGKVYIGQSRDLERRKYEHFRSLNKGKHHNLYLQRAYNADGAENFHYIVLEECPLDELNEREVYWINQLQTMDMYLGYNLEGGGNQDKIVSEQSRECKRGNKNPMYGKKLSKEHVEALRVRNRCHGSSLNEETVKKIKQELFDGAVPKDLAEKYGVTRHVICKIKTGKNFYWVSPELNEFITEEYRKKQRDKKIIELDKMGYSRRQIQLKFGIDSRIVKKVLGTPSDVFVKNNPEKQALRKNVISDFLEGIDRKEIMKKYGIKPQMYVSIISETYKKKMAETKQKAIELRKSGMMVKDIAKQLGFARTTITKWTLESCKHRDNPTN